MLRSQKKQVGVADRALFGLLSLLIVTGFLTAGGSRDDILSLLVWRPLSVMVLTVSLLLCLPAAWHHGRTLLIFAGAVIGLVVIHLVPLPPSVWSALPGRELIVSVYRDAGMALPWLPLSITPDRTWNALFALCAPAAALLLALSLNVDRHVQALKVIIALGVLSGMIGLLQAIGPADGPFYFYRITNNGSSVGLFANRNHQAVFLACLFPLLAAHLSLVSGARDKLAFVRLVSFSVAVFLIPLLLITGSRAGVVIGFLAVLLSVWVYQTPVERGRALRKISPKAEMAVFCAALVFAIVLTILLGRAEGFDRLFENDVADDLRAQALPTLLDACWHFFPFGSGIGSFVETYQIFEPDDLLSPNYFNHAHNDFLEVLLTASLPGVALTLAGFALYLGVLPRLHRKRGQKEGAGATSGVVGRAGAVIVLLLALGSIADYPLRVPSLAVLFVTSSVWMVVGCSWSDGKGVCGSRVSNADR